MELVAGGFSLSDIRGMDLISFGQAYELLDRAQSAKSLEIFQSVRLAYHGKAEDAKRWMRELLKRARPKAGNNADAFLERFGSGF